MFFLLILYIKQFRKITNNNNNILILINVLFVTIQLIFFKILFGNMNFKQCTQLIFNIKIVHSCKIKTTFFNLQFF